MRDKKVLLCLNGKIIGGAERMSMHLAEELSKQNSIEVLLNAKDTREHELFNNYVTKVIVNNHFASKLRPFHFLFKLIQFLQILIFSKYDLIIFENKFLMQIGIPIAKLLRKQIWIYVHYPVTEYEIKRCFYKYANKIILCCSNLDKYFIHSEQLRLKLQVLPNFVEPIILLKKIKTVEEIVLTCIGHISEVKGQKFIIELAKEISSPKLKIYLIGSVKAENLWYQKECLRLVQLYGLEEQIIFTGQIGNANEYLSMTDIYIQPSLAEGLPLSILEAMANSLPIVAFETDGISEAVISGHNGYLLSKNDLLGFKEKIVQLATDSENCRLLGNYSYKLFDEKFRRSNFHENCQRLFT